jgi:hypothetical protein
MCSLLLENVTERRARSEEIQKAEFVVERVRARGEGIDKSYQRREGKAL